MNARRTGVLFSSLALVLFSASASLAKQPPGDPPGNNGTIKVVASDPSDPDPGNEPHLDSCLLWLEFYGFDQGQTADITFRAHPPTGDGELLTHPDALISDDAAGGGQDADEVLGYNLASALAQYEPHPQQGYHVKVTSDSQEAPGGPKQKVFWLKCAQVATGTLKLTKAVEGGTGGPFKFSLVCNHSPRDKKITLAKAGDSETIADIPGGTTCVVVETEMGGAASNTFAETPSDDAADGKVVVPGGGTVDLVVTNIFGSPPAVQPAGTSDDAGAGGAEVAGVSETRTNGQPPAGAAEVAGASEVAGVNTLPRTGASPWPLLVTAAVLLAAGMLLLTGTRRRLATR